MKIAIDFDGTIVEEKYKDGNIYFPDVGPLKPFAAEVITRLYLSGHDLMLWTCRANGDGEYRQGLRNALKFLDDIWLLNMFCGINEDPSPAWEGYPKPVKIGADCYIDDRVPFGFQGWAKIYNWFLCEHLVEELYIMPWGSYDGRSLRMSVYKFMRKHFHCKNEFIKIMNEFRNRNKK